jgi:hypothetical protein
MLVAEKGGKTTIPIYLNLETPTISENSTNRIIISTQYKRPALVAASV